MAAITIKDLRGNLQLIELLYKAGVKAYFTAYHSNYRVPTREQILNVTRAVLMDINDHVEKYNIHMKGLDSNKLVNYFAWHLEKEYSIDGTPLFYAYLYYLSESKKDTRQGCHLWSIPSLMEICENLSTFHKSGQILAPYTFIKAVNLMWEHVVVSPVCPICNP